MSHVVFALLIAVDVLALAVFALLGLAAAKPSHTPVVAVLGFFAVPVLVLLGVVWLYRRQPWPASRALAFGVAGVPVLLVVGGAIVSGGAAWWSGEPAMGSGRPDAAAQGALEVAIAAGDAASAARLASDRRHPVNDGAALVQAIRRLETTPGDAAVLQALLQAGLQPNAGGGPEPVLAAAIRASRRAGIEPVRLLLAAGADPNHRAGTQPAWFAALQAGTPVEVLALVLDARADLKAVDMAGQGAVQVALAQRHWAALDRLVERGAAWQAARSSEGQDLRQVVAMQLRRTPDDAALRGLAQRLQGTP